MLTHMCTGSQRLMVEFSRQRLPSTTPSALWTALDSDALVDFAWNDVIMLLMMSRVCWWVCLHRVGRAKWARMAANTLALYSLVLRLRRWSALSSSSSSVSSSALNTRRRRQSWLFYRVAKMASLSVLHDIVQTLGDPAC